MSVPHGVNNWLHHLLLAIQAAEPASVIATFAADQPLDICGPESDQQWQDVSQWQQWVRQSLAPFRVGEPHIRLLEQAVIQYDGATPDQAAVHFKVSMRIRNRDLPPLELDCAATLIQEQGRWVACRLHCRYLNG